MHALPSLPGILLEIDFVNFTQTFAQLITCT